MHLAIDGTLWEKQQSDGYDRMALSVLGALGQPVTFLGKGAVPAFFEGYMAKAMPGRWLQAPSTVMEKLRPAGWLKRTVPRVMTEAHLDRWVSFSGNVAAPGGRIFLKDVSSLLWPDTAPRGAADALRARYAEALEDPAAEVLLFSQRAAELLGDGVGADRLHVLPPFYPAPGWAASAGRPAPAMADSAADDRDAAKAHRAADGRDAATAHRAAADRDAAKAHRAAPDRDAAKAHYGQGKEYFLWTGSAEDHWRDAMKAFSQFKLRQRSQMGLLLAPWDAKNEELRASLETYKFRADVTLLEPNHWEQAALGAYALLHTPGMDELGWVTLAALTLGTPIITARQNVAREWAADAAEWIDPGDPGSIVEAMLQLFKDEAYRGRLVKKGNVIAETFEPEKTINRYLCHLS